MYVDMYVCMYTCMYVCRYVYQWHGQMLHVHHVYGCVSPCAPLLRCPPTALESHQSKSSGLGPSIGGLHQKRLQKSACIRRSLPSPPPTYIGWFVASSVAISFGSGAGLVDLSFHFLLAGAATCVPPHKLPKTVRFLIKFKQFLSAAIPAAFPPTSCQKLSVS